MNFFLLVIRDGRRFLRFQNNLTIVICFLNICRLFFYSQRNPIIAVIFRYLTMLAPRKKLWSTPYSAVESIRTLSKLTASDRVYDLGCGDCRVLIHLARTTQCKYFVGVEIDADRTEEARKAVLMENLDPDIYFEIRCENALETCFDDATVLFLYLVPRGLALIHPLLLEVVEKRQGKDSCADGNDQPILRVITYMAQLKGETYEKMLLCSVAHQPLAAWPLYLYHFPSL